MGNACTNTFPNAVALEFGESRKHLVEQLAGCRGEVEPFGERHELHVAGAQILKEADQVCQGSPEPIQLPDEQDADLPRFASASIGSNAGRDSLEPETPSSTKVTGQAIIAAGGKRMYTLGRGMCPRRFVKLIVHELCD